MNPDQTAPMIWFHYRPKVQKQMREQTTIVVNGRKGLRICAIKTYS